MQWCIISLTYWVWTACWSTQWLLARQNKATKEWTLEKNRAHKHLMHGTVHHSATTKPGVDYWVTAVLFRAWMIIQITWSCPQCTALSCPEPSQTELFGPIYVWWPGLRGAEGAGWWWMSPVSSEAHVPHSEFSCRGHRAHVNTITTEESSCLYVEWLNLILISIFNRWIQ